MGYERLNDATGASGGEPLNELDAFLAQIGYGHYYGRRESAPVANALPREWTPAVREAKTEPARRERRGWAWAVAMTVVVGALLWTPLQYACASLQETWAMATHPFVYQFDLTQPGTKVAEVCERLGLPAARRAIVGPLGQEEWIYTAHSARDASEDLLCILMVRSGRVMWKSKVPGPLH